MSSPAESTARSLAVGYAFDDRLRQDANRQGRNYWYAYVAEILSRLGSSARPVPPAAVADPRALADLAVLILGDFPLAPTPALADWVRQGGVLIGLATEGLEALFGIAPGGRIPQPDDPFAITGYLELLDSPITAGCRAPIEPAQRLIVISPIRLVHPTDAYALARLWTADPDHPGRGDLARDAQAPAITHRPLGAGHAFYFAFNLAQTLWTLLQGRPVDRDYDGDGYWRVSDACVLADNSRAVPYADALHFLLANMIARRPVPLVSPIPPRQGRVAPCLLFFGGDDEGATDVQAPASDFMASRGLPYHLNVMPLQGRFPLPPEAQARIEANGHEIALHYNFIDGFQHPGGFTRDDVLHQAALFRQRFGRDSVCTVSHWCRWTGWADPARWMREAGGWADNSRIHWTSPPLNPTNRLGFAFGSALPRHFWDDAAHGNERLDFLMLPVAAYELGYDKDRCYSQRLREALDLAVRFHLTLNFFWHPVYIARYPTCQQAIDELVRLMAALPVPPVLMGPDELCRWWLARSRAVIRGAEARPGLLRCEADGDWPAGFVLRVPIGRADVASACVDGRPADVQTAAEFGQHWAAVPLAAGRHVLELDLDSRKA